LAALVCSDPLLYQGSTLPIPVSSLHSSDHVIGVGLQWILHQKLYLHASI